MDSLLHASTDLLASGKPFRSLLPDLFDRLLTSFDASEATLVLRTPQGYRVAYRSPPGSGSAASELERIAAATLTSSPAQPPSTVLSTPMHFASTAIGGIALARRSRAFTPAELELLETWAAILSLSLHQIGVEEENKRLEAIAEIDQLTGIANRRAFDVQARRHAERSLETHEPLSVLIFDIDYFKSYNDRYGHLAGDGALRHVAQVMRACLHRPNDLVARFGGEEFVVVLPQTREDEAIALAERMRAAVFELRIPHEDSGLGILTISGGVTSLDPRDTDSNDLLARADANLYKAKGAGRNHVAANAYLSQSVPAARPGTGVHHLPTARTPFVGRAAELAHLSDMLARTRLATVAGPGGAG